MCQDVERVFLTKLSLMPPCEEELATANNSATLKKKSIPNASGYSNSVPKNASIQRGATIVAAAASAPDSVTPLVSELIQPHPAANFNTASEGGGASATNSPMAAPTPSPIAVTNISNVITPSNSRPVSPPNAAVTSSTEIIGNTATTTAAKTNTITEQSANASLEMDSPPFQNSVSLAYFLSVTLLINRVGFSVRPLMKEEREFNEFEHSRVYF